MCSKILLALIHKTKTCHYFNSKMTTIYFEKIFNAWALVIFVYINDICMKLQLSCNTFCNLSPNETKVILSNINR